jgi:hypothetical protein
LSQDLVLLWTIYALGATEDARFMAGPAAGFRRPGKPDTYYGSFLSRKFSSVAAVGLPDQFEHQLEPPWGVCLTLAARDLSEGTVVHPGVRRVELGMI